MRRTGNPAATAQPAGGSRWVRDDRYTFIATAMLWGMVVLMVVPENFNYAALVEGTSAPFSGGALSRLQWLGLMGLGGALLLYRAGLASLLLRWVNPFLLLFVVLAVCSAWWSIEPTFTVRRLVRLATIMLVAIGFCLIAWHRTRLQEGLRPILTLILAGSIVFGLVFPEYGIHRQTSYELVGAWRGLTNHKNTLGALSCIGVILWTHAWMAREVKGLPALLGGGIAVVCLLLSRSSTSLLTTVLVVAFLFLFLRGPHLLRRIMPYCTALFVVVLLAYAIAVLRLVPGLEVLLHPVTLITGKDLTFTGRSDIWAIIVEHIRFAPWFGTGYGAYWIGPVPHSPSFEFVRKMWFYPGSSHNGYIEVVNDLGFVGLTCLLTYLIVYLVQALRLVRVDREQAALYLALFTQQALSNLSESRWFNVLTLDFVIMTLATVALARTGLEIRLRYYFGAPVAPAPSPTYITPATPALTGGRS